MAELPAEPVAGDRFSVLMVCTGNIGRSPMMERIMRHELSRRAVGQLMDVSSAGTWGQAGQTMEPGAVIALQERGVNTSEFAATPLTSDLIAAADLVLVATREHRSAVVSVAPGAVRRTFTLHELARIVQFAPPSRLSAPAADAGGDLDGEDQQMRDAVAWAAQLRGSVPRPAHADDDDVPDPLGAPNQVYRERAAAIAASVERIVPYLLREPHSG